MKHRIIVVLLTCAMTSLINPAIVAEDLNVLPKDTNSLLYKHLLQQSKQLYAKRAAEVEVALRSPEAIRKRGERLLSDYRRIIGELPKEKTPLNAEITGVIECDGYRIENVTFESQPDGQLRRRRHVTSCGNNGSTKRSGRPTAVSVFRAKWRLAMTTSPRARYACDNHNTMRS